MPNLTLFGLNEMRSCMFEAPDVPSKHSAIEHFRKAPLVIEIDDFLGTLFSAAIGAPSSDEAKKNAGEAASKVGLRGRPNAIERKIRGPTIQPNRLDWRIINA